MVLRTTLRTAFVLLLCLAISAPANGQTSSPSTGRAIALGVVSAAVVVVTIYSIVHNRHKGGNTGNMPSFVGCTSTTDHGLVLTDEKDGEEYVILGANTVKTGERVQVWARKDEDDAGRLALNVGRVVKDYGPCTAPTAPTAP